MYDAIYKFTSVSAISMFDCFDRIKPLCIGGHTVSIAQEKSRNYIYILKYT